MSSWGKECSKCRLKNHFARCCKDKNKEKQKVRKVKDEDDSLGDDDDDDDGSSDWVYAVENSFKDRDLKCKTNNAGKT